MDSDKKKKEQVKHFIAYITTLIKIPKDFLNWETTDDYLKSVIKSHEDHLNK